MFDKVIHQWLRLPHRLHVSASRPKKPRATLVFIHGIGVSSSIWKRVTTDLPEDLAVATIDLLGFGSSPKPTKTEYNARLQARSVVRTCKKLRLSGPVVIVGHSLGALVAVEIARLYPSFAKSLILCSPPFYKVDSSARKLLPSTDRLLKDLYRSIRKNPEQFIKISRLAAKYGLADRAFTLNDSNVHSYMGALEASIVNQTALQDAQSLQLPMYILYGTLDPVLVSKNIKLLQRSNPNVRVKPVVTAHNISGRYIPAVRQAIKTALEDLKPLS